MKSFWAFLFLAGAVACHSSTSGEKKEQNKNDTVINPVTGTDTNLVKQPHHPTPLSTVINGLLDARYPGKWIVVNDSVARWRPDVFEYFILKGRAKDHEYPYIVKGDFNGDGEKDVAALVRETKGKDFQVAIILRNINKSDQNEYHFWTEDIDLAAIEIYPKGEIQNLDTKPVQMLGDGITVEYFEKASFVIYRDGKAFKRVYTSD